MMDNMYSGEESPLGDEDQLGSFEERLIAGGNSEGREGSMNAM